MVLFVDENLLEELQALNFIKDKAAIHRRNLVIPVGRIVVDPPVRIAAGGKKSHLRRSRSGCRIRLAIAGKICYTQLCE